MSNNIVTLQNLNSLASERIDRISPFVGQLLLRLIIVSLGLCASNGLALEIGGGLAAIEDGDNRLRPSAVVQLANDNVQSKFGYYGRDFGPVKERTYLLSVGRKFSIYNKDLLGTVGGSALYESTRIAYSDGSGQVVQFNSTNLGGFFGLNWVFIDTSLIKLAAAWDSHVFTAGGDSLLLANIRKASLGLVGSVLF